MGASIVRTVTAYVVGWIMAFSFVQSIGLTTEQVDWAVTGAVTGVAPVLGSLYYAAVRAIESRWPGAGMLLGRRGAPSYEREI